MKNCLKQAATANTDRVARANFIIVEDQANCKAAEAEMKGARAKEKEKLERMLEAAQKQR